MIVLQFKKKQTKTKRCHCPLLFNKLDRNSWPMQQCSLSRSLPGMSGPAWGVSGDCAVLPSCCQCQNPPSAWCPSCSFPGAPAASPSAVEQRTLATSGSESRSGSGRPGADWQSDAGKQKNWWGRKKRQTLCWNLALWCIPLKKKTDFVIWFKVQHQLLQCCMIVPGGVNNRHFKWVFFRRDLFIRLLAVTPAVVVGPVLSVDKQLHLELGSQHGFSDLLFLLLYDFDLCLEKTKKICIVDFSVKQTKLLNVTTYFMCLLLSACTFTQTSVRTCLQIRCVGGCFLMNSAIFQRDIPKRE